VGLVWRSLSTLPLRAGAEAALLYLGTVFQAPCWTVIDLQVVMQRLPAVAFGADDTATVAERVRCAQTLTRTRNPGGIPNGQLKDRTRLSVVNLLPESPKRGRSRPGACISDA